MQLSRNLLYAPQHQVHLLQIEVMVGMVKTSESYDWGSTVKSTKDIKQTKLLIQYSPSKWLLLKQISVPCVLARMATLASSVSP